MKLQKALEELNSGNCDGIRPVDFTGEGIYIMDSGGAFRFKREFEDSNILSDVYLHVDALLGEWELVGEKVRPQPGEFWEIQDKESRLYKKYFIYKNGDIYGITKDGEYIVITKDMYEGNNCYRIFPLKRGLR